VLLLELRAPVEVLVGSLGQHSFSPGAYAYAGSAMAGVKPRLVRHARRDKVVHWHVDRLTVLPSCHVLGALILPPDGPDECRTAEMLGDLEGARIRPPRFGASDHRCAGHLVQLGEPDGAIEGLASVLTARDIGGLWWPVEGFSRPGGWRA
jgi:Uri superfamily endonuclease